MLLTKLFLFSLIKVFRRCWNFSKKELYHKIYQIWWCPLMRSSWKALEILKTCDDKWFDLKRYKIIICSTTTHFSHLWDLLTSKCFQNVNTFFFLLKATVKYWFGVIFLNSIFNNSLGRPPFRIMIYWKLLIIRWFIFSRNYPYSQFLENPFLNMRSDPWIEFDIYKGIWKKSLVIKWFDLKR